VKFTTNLISAAAKMFPSKFFSTGGDEINANCYLEDSETQRELNASGQTIEQALDIFIQSTHAALTAEGKTPVVWEGWRFPAVTSIATRLFFFL
jgi:hexosaminidase